MPIIPESEVRKVNKISPDEEQRILDFLQGAIYCWCKNQENAWFSLRDLMGGENFNWGNTPMQVLYEKHKDTQDDPVKQAAIDGGWLLKKLLSDPDEREFDTRKVLRGKGEISEYRWIKE